MPRRRGRRARKAAGLAAGSAVSASILYFLDPVSGRRRRKLVVDRAAGTVRHARRRVERRARGVQSAAYGKAQQLAHLREAPKELDDVTLAHKVETELFRDPHVPKGEINVNVQHGIVQLRGAVQSQDMLEELVERARAIRGVREVENLLHLPSEPAPMHQ